MYLLYTMLRYTIHIRLCYNYTLQETALYYSESFVTMIKGIHHWLILLMIHHESVAFTKSSVPVASKQTHVTSQSSKNNNINKKTKVIIATGGLACLVLLLRFLHQPAHKKHEPSKNTKITATDIPYKPTILPMKRIAVDKLEKNLGHGRMIGIRYNHGRASNQLYGMMSIGRNSGEDYYTITAANGAMQSFFIDNCIKLFKLVEQEAEYTPVVVEKYQANALHVGDVVAYKNPSGEEIAYGRIIGRTQDIEYQTADYAVITADQSVAKLTSHMIQRVYR